MWPKSVSLSDNFTTKWKEPQSEVIASSDKLQKEQHTLEDLLEELEALDVPISRRDSSASIARPWTMRSQKATNITRQCAKDRGKW